MARRVFGLLLLLAILPAALTAQVRAPAPATAPRDSTSVSTPTGPTSGEAIADTTSRRFKLRAGKGRIVLEGGERVTYLESGVRVESDSTTIESRRARVFRDREHAIFYENVVVHDGKVVMEGDEGEFIRAQDVAELRGRVRIRDPRGLILAKRARYQRDLGVLRLWGDVDFQDPKTRVQSDSAIYYERVGNGDAFGNVVLTDRESGTEARGPRAVYDRTTGEARMVSRPHMVVREKDAEDTEIEADDLQMDRDRTQLRARGDVRIRRGDTAARGDSAQLDRTRNIVRLRGNPEVRQGTSRMLGREIDVYYAAREVERVEVRHEAQLIQSRADTLLIPDPNVVRGDSARLYFENGDLSRAIVVGRASSTYVPKESRPNRISINEADADSIVMMFEKDEVQEVLFDGTATGTYRYFEGNLDSLKAPAPVVVDSVFGVVRGDTTHFDFRQRAERVEYMAERILYLAKQNDLLLQNAAQVDYQSRTLRAGRIRYDADTDLLEATERPVLDESGDRMYGEKMGYDMTTKKAWVNDASTTFDQGYYEGRDLRKEPDGTLQVQHGSYTTCDLAHPHYRFESDRMKVYLKDKVVGSPVRIYLGNVPVGWLPFIVNSANTARHSGFLQPYFELGIASNSRFIRGLDYYWAASPYYDFLFSADYTDRERPNRSSVGAFLESAKRDTRGFGLSVFTRYKWRYHFDGNIEYRFTQENLNAFRGYTLRGNHDQRIGERATLRGSLDYASNSQANKRAYDQRDYERSLNRQLASALSLNRPGDLVSLSANLRRVQRVDPESTFTGELTSMVMPNLNVTFRSIRLGPAPRDPEHPGWAGFLHDLQLTPGFNFARTTSEVRARRDSTNLPPGPVSFADSFFTFDTEVITASTGAGLSRRFNVLFLNLAPAVGYSENYRKDSQRPNDKRHFRDFNTSLGASTTLFGTFYPRVFGLNALRHVIDPSATISYRPEIAGQQRRSTGVNLNLRQKFDVKVQRGEEERRIDGLLVWTLSTSYNPTILGEIGRPDRKFTNITSSLTINQSGPLTVQVSQVYDPYAGRIVSTRVPFQFGLSGRFGYGDTGLAAAERNRVVQEEGESAGTDSTAVEGRPRVEDQPDPLAEVQPVTLGTDGSLSWNLGLSYSLERSFGVTQHSRVGVFAQVQPTRNWSVRYNASYDGRLRTLANPAIHVTRDLHCWKASFSRIRDIDEWRYYFRIWVTKHEQDLFLENGERSLGYSQGY